MSEATKAAPAHHAKKHAHSMSANHSQLTELAAASHLPIVAVDMDDVLSQTNRVVAEWHNDTYGSEMTLAHFYYYYYWKNPYWGGPEETIKKVEEFYATLRLDNAPPIEGALESLEALKEMGFRLIVVTARQRREMERSMRWLEKHYPGLFDSMVCTGQSQETLADEHEVLTRLNKAQVCHTLGAKFIVDDSLENALKCATSDPPIPVLLFGDNEWNQRVAKYDDIKKEVSFAVRLEREGGREFWKDENVTIPEGVPVTRVKDWGEVVEWVVKARREGRIN